MLDLCCDTNSNAEIPLFILRELPDDMAHLCPVRALAEWVGTSEILHGYLFHRMDKRDRPIVAKNTHMVRAPRFLITHVIHFWILDPR